MGNPLLGTILIQAKICSAEQVEAGLRRQQELATRNHYKHLGTILLEMGIISLTQLHRALQRQQSGSGQNS